MSKETSFAMVDMLLNEDMCGDYINPRNSPGIILDFIGGEPFLETQLIDETLMYFQERTMELDHP